MPPSERSGPRHLDVTEVELVGGVEQRDLVIADPDPTWPQAFAQHADRIRAALGLRAQQVEHVGSTSVPGLAAEPIIDILLSVEDITAEEDYLEPLLRAGYQLRERGPRHRMLRTPTLDAHVHVHESSDAAATHYLLLRDHLRCDDADRELYERTKREVVRADRADISAYADAKSALIAQIRGRSTGNVVAQAPVGSTWPGLTDASHSRWYVERFQEMAARGEDLHGEARLVDALAPRRARLLDAGCGPGRLGGHLATLGHEVVGVDIDPVLVEAARTEHPGATWVVSDLVRLDLSAHGETATFDGAFIVGNVLAFVTPEHRADVLERIAAHLRPEAFLVIGCRADHGFTADDVGTILARLDLTLEHRFATYDMRPWRADSPFSVSVARTRVAP
ncbi:MAG: GrpB family protein [Nocardioides sp.]|nr:GrpB family protein [Nocardioides sp.]